MVAQDSTEVRPEAGRAAAELNGRHSRRAELLDVAALLFFEKGYEATTIQEIADRFGVTKGSLYHYIDSKQDLLYSVILDTHRGALSELRPVTTLDCDATTKIRRFIELHSAYNIGRLTQTAVVYNDFRSLEMSRRDEIVSIRDEIQSVLRSLIELGQVEGLVSARLNPAVTTIAILSMTTGLYRWYRPEKELGPAEVGRHFADIVTLGLQDDGATHAPALVFGGFDAPFL